MTTNSQKSQWQESDLNYYGEKVTPIMQALPNKLQQLVSAMLCTSEGFNVCSMGFGNEQISKMAAVSSSLYAMSKSVIDAFSGNKNNKITIVSIHSQELDILGKKVELKDGRELILIIATKGTPTGIQLYAAQYVEDELRKIT